MIAVFKPPLPPHASPPSRRQFLQQAGSALGVLTLAGCVSKAQRGGAEKPPNILFILADDLGYHQVQPFGDPYFESPRIAAFATEGLRFTDAYAAAPICSPTRASLMTGKSPARLHLTNYIPGAPFPYAKLRIPDWTPQLALEETTVAELLSARGYACGHFGKWHLNSDKNYEPGRPGDPGSQGFHDVLTTEKPESNADPCADAHNAEKITRHAVEFLRAHRDKPFFCYVSHNSIHRPELECAGAIAKYAAKPASDAAQGRNPVEAAMVETLDRSIGELLGAVDELGLRENTLVVFFSDNGPLHGFNARKPYYGGKGDLYEGGIRVPMIVRWPGVIAPGTTCSEPVVSTDFFRTFGAVAGAAAPTGVDGVSLLPLFRSEGKLNRSALCFHYPHYHRLTSDTPAMEHPVSPHGAIRSGNYKLIEWFEESLTNPESPRAYSLFDLGADPGEARDISAKEPEITKRLAKQLREWRESVGAQMPTLNPAHDPARENWRQADRL